MLAHSFTLRSVWARSVHLGLRGAYALPHPKKAHRGGEDAFFSHENGIGVADGVGGYAQHGIDPAIFTRNVMRFALDAVKNHCNKPGGISALDTLEYAADHARRAGQPGGCPVTLVTLTEDASASILNLGDCGTMLLRGKDLVLCTQVQQHYFNCPYQLPEDPPSSGNCTDVKLEIGDLLLCASDGVLDNVELDDLVAHLREVDATGCGGVASAIGKQAFHNAQDPQFVSPFAKHARNAGYQYSGGKLDDITVVIAKVTAADHSDGKDVACPPLITDLLSINA